MYNLRAEAISDTVLKTSPIKYQTVHFIVCTAHKSMSIQNALLWKSFDWLRSVILCGSPFKYTLRFQIPCFACFLILVRFTSVDIKLQGCCLQCCAWLYTQYQLEKYSAFGLLGCDLNQACVNLSHNKFRGFRHFWELPKFDW